MALWRTGGVRWLVASTAAGLGLHKQHVRIVATLMVPRRIEDFNQMIGRAGRDGEPALCISIYDDRLLQLSAPLVKLTKGSGAIGRFRQMVAMLSRESPSLEEKVARSSCRRAEMLSLLGLRSSAAIALRIPREKCCDACASSFEPASHSSVDITCKPLDSEQRELLKAIADTTNRNEDVSFSELMNVSSTNRERVRKLFVNCHLEFESRYISVFSQTEGREIHVGRWCVSVSETGFQKNDSLAMRRNVLDTKL